MPMSGFAMDHNPLQQLHSPAALAGWIQPGPILQFRDPLEYFPMNFLIELLDKSKHDAHSWWGVGCLCCVPPFSSCPSPASFPYTVSLSAFRCQLLLYPFFLPQPPPHSPSLAALSFLHFPSVNSSADGGRMVDVHVHLVSCMLGFCLTHAGPVRAVPITLSSCVHLSYCVWNFPWSYPPPLTILLLPLLGGPLSLVGTGVICMYHCGYLLHLGARLSQGAGLSHEKSETGCSKLFNGWVARVKKKL